MTGRGPGGRGRGGSVAALAAGLAVAACEGRLAQQPFEGTPPTWPPLDCAAPTAARPTEATPTAGPIAEGTLRAGPTMREHRVVERYAVRWRECHRVGTSRLETPRGASEIEVVWDAAWRPLRVEMRRAPPGRPDDVTVETVELRGERAMLTRRSPRGHVEHRVLRGPVPQAVIPSGRGLLVGWIRAARLDVGEKTRVPALDVTKYARIRDVTLRRDPDRDERTMGERVRVYTVYGRESVFADAADAVVGDLAGLRPAAASPPESSR